MFTMGEDTRNIREAVIALRRAGKSRREIRAELGIGNSTLDRLVQGAPPAPWTARPRAKDALRVRARELRSEGRFYPEIAAELGVSKSSVSLWVRDLPRPKPDYASRPQCSADALARMNAARSQRAEAKRREQKLTARAQVSGVSERELLLLGTALYWAEGSKDKPWARSEQVRFINSDPDVVRVYLRWLDVLGVPEADRTYRLSIHESADVDRAVSFWANVVSADPKTFLKTTLKRANPNPRRRNLGEGYYGCLVIRVKRSSILYRKIDGWWQGVVLRTNRTFSDAPGGGFEPP
jgi:transposase